MDLFQGGTESRTGLSVDCDGTRKDYTATFSTRSNQQFHEGNATISYGAEGLDLYGKKSIAIVRH